MQTAPGWTIKEQKAICTEEYINEIGLDGVNVRDSRVRSDIDKIGKYVYYFQVSYGPEHWILRKNLNKVKQLDKYLKKDLRYEKQDNHYLDKLINDHSLQNLQEKKLEGRDILSHLSTYLNNLRHIPSAHSLPLLFRFLEIPSRSQAQPSSPSPSSPSQSSIDKSSSKYKSFYGLKRQTWRLNRCSCECMCCAHCCHSSWQHHYFIVDTCGLYLRLQEHHQHLESQALFSNNFTLLKHRRTKTITLRLTQEVQVKLNDLFEYYDTLWAIQVAARESVYTAQQPYKAFSYETSHNQCRFLVDGAAYFQALSEELPKAHKEVFIAGWWVSPQVYLRRPVSATMNQEYRLDRVLLGLAQRGVSIYIVVYNAPSYFTTLDSQYTQTYLMGLHKNILVIRHPQFFLPTFLWSHHEKIVVIDQTVGFVGGLDLCYGRYDQPSHSLAEQGADRMWPGIDYCNPRQVDFTNVRAYEKSDIDPEKDSRMPWHDVAVMFRGEAVNNLARHFVQYWTYALAELKNKKHYKAVRYLGDQPKRGKIQRVRESIRRVFHKKEEHSPKKDQLPKHNQIQEEQSKDISDYESEWKDINDIGRDLAQTQKETTSQPDQVVIDQADPVVIEQTNPVMMDLSPPPNKTSTEKRPSLVKQRTYESPIKDLLVTKKRSSTAMRPEDHLHLQKQIMLVSNQQESVERFKGVLKQLQSDMIINNSGKHHKKCDRPVSPKNMSSKMKKQLLKHSPIALLSSERPSQNPEFSCRVNVLRSANQWSIGLENQQRENSIQLAYLDQIIQAQHFIYIENQFFISSCAGRPVSNQIVQTIVDRIIRAAQAGSKFRVFVVMPLLPGFPGEVNSSEAKIMKVQLHWEYASICRGGNSLMEQLCRHPKIGPERVGKYIKFFGLRTHGEVGGIPVTEQIYVHSKLMIIDDQVAILGSANINDRSMHGDRDSEVDVMITDDNLVASKMDGKDYKAGKAVLQLRNNLFQEHFGEFHQDPLDDQFLSRVSEQARLNNALYRQIFGCYPDDTMQTVTQIALIRNQATTHDYHHLKHQIKGNACEWPLQFLAKENLYFKVYEKESLCPTETFT